jgi:hypothetical protein
VTVQWQAADPLNLQGCAQPMPESGGCGPGDIIAACKGHSLQIRPRVETYVSRYLRALHRNSQSQTASSAEPAVCIASAFPGSRNPQLATGQSQSAWPDD